jgi:hypothetical protein
LFHVKSAPHVLAAHGKTCAVTDLPYRQFLEAKVRMAPADGFDVDPEALNPALKPHVRAAARWALAGGRRAFFGRFGLQKTTWHLEVMRQVQKRTGLPTLITLPLGARISFFHDAKAFFTGKHRVRLNFMRDDSELDPKAINLTNIECIRAGKIDARRFGGTSYDEGDVLRNMNTQTFWSFTNDVKTNIRYRFVATATPDPQDYVELIAYAAYLDIMEIGEARTRFFQRDSEEADNLTLLPHMQEQFFLWLMSWALFLNKPSDLNPSFDDAGYELPPLDVRWHEVPTNHRAAGYEANGQGKLIKDDATGVLEANAEKRETIAVRVEKLTEVMTQVEPRDRKGQQWVLWCHLNDEQRAIEKALAARALTHSSIDGSQDLDTKEGLLVDWMKRKTCALLSKPVMLGAGLNLQQCNRAVFVGINPKFKDFIQSVHRQLRYGQKNTVICHIIYSEAERETRRKMEERWRAHNEQPSACRRWCASSGWRACTAVATLKQTIG